MMISQLQEVKQDIVTWRDELLIQMGQEKWHRASGGCQCEADYRYRRATPKDGRGIP